MGVREAHGPNPLEVNKFDTIDELSFFSIASYRCANHKEPLKAFEHKHEEIEFVIPISTVHLFKHDNFKAIGECGFIYPVNSNVNHGFDHDLNKTSICSITISKEYALERAKAHGRDRLYLNNRFPINELVYRLIKEFQRNAKAEYPNKVLLKELAQEITDLLLEGAFEGGDHGPLPIREYDPSIRKVLDYMFLNFRNPDLDLNSLAFYCGYSPAYFSRVFKQYVGDSPITHLNRLRISESRALFFNKNLSLEEISELVGFRNLSTFTEAFKKITGDRPKNYRTRNLKNIHNKQP